MARKHKILVEDPHIKSHAALLLLAKRLQKETIAEWLKFREAFLSRYNVLECTHCGKTGLLIETENLDLLATVDHVIPLSKGGKQFDERNCIVSCYSCNNNRKNIDIDIFRKRKSRK